VVDLNFINNFFDLYRLKSKRWFYQLFLSADPF
jgi:hypothetical protein